MADTPNDNSPPNKAQREVQEAMRKEIASLKRDINKVNRTLAERAEQVADEAGGWFGSATGGASRAARHAHSVSETLQQNPGTVSSAFVLGGIFGLIVGIVLSQPDVFDRRWI